jgi:hypothetical protein
MQFVAILELPTVNDNALTGALLGAAWQASRRGPVALLLPKGAGQAVDRQLDPLVAANRRVHGVRYRTASDPDVWAKASRNTLVVAASSDARRNAATIGADCLDLEAGLAALTGLAQSSVAA